MLDKRIKVKKIQDLGAGNHLLRLASPKQAGLTRPGQFLMLKCAQGINDPPLLRRPYSIFDIWRQPKTGHPAGMDILVKNVGGGSARLAGLKPGDAVQVLGPLGRPFEVPVGLGNRIRFACLVGGGVGIAALLLLARKLLEQNTHPVLFYGGRVPDDLVLREPFERLGIETHYTTEDGSMGERGQVTLPLEGFLSRYARAGLRVYACGPWGMMKAAHNLAVRHEVPCEVSLEARMGCALGACLGCTIRAWDEKGEEQFLRVCQEGPVMSSRTVDWETPPI